MTKQKVQPPEPDYRSLFDNASDAIWIHDIDGHITYANKAAESLTGYSLAELAGMNILNFLVDKESHDKAREVRNHLLKAQQIEQPYEQHIVRKDGSTAILRMATSLVVSDGQVTGFQHIARDATEERRMHENMRYYVQEIIKAQEAERLRIAREIHDDVSPALLLLIQQIDTITGSSRLKSAETLDKKMESLRHQAIEALESARRIAQDLRPRILDDLGLVPALEWLAENFFKLYGFDCCVETKGKERLLSAEVQLLMFRIAQEALNNVRKHSGATRAQVVLEFFPYSITLSVTDNGQGFELPGRMGDMTTSGKLGLAGMQERTQLIGGTICIESEPGKGTTVTVAAPA